MSSVHPYQLIKLPSDAPFELRPAPGKGWGAFAIRRIEPGNFILVETPLFVIRKRQAICAEEDVRAAYRRLSVAKKQQFSLLRDNSSRLFHSMAAAFAENCFNLGGDNEPDLRGLFLVHSRLNHSCLPNVKIKNAGRDAISSTALRRIMPGEEICFSYNAGFEAKASFERHRILRFVCACKACLRGTAFQQCSDMRRRLIHGLTYLRQGEDADGKVQDSGSSPIIVDLDLKKAAEQGKTRLSSRFIYELLSLVLMEQEGLLDDLLLARVKPALDQMAGVFRTKHNANIALVAMAQQTWLKRLDVACWLWGRPDAADAELHLAIATWKHGTVVNSSSQA